MYYYCRLPICSQEVFVSILVQRQAIRWYIGTLVCWFAGQILVLLIGSKSSSHWGIAAELQHGKSEKVIIGNISISQELTLVPAVITATSIIHAKVPSSYSSFHFKTRTTGRLQRIKEKGREWDLLDMDGAVDLIFTLQICYS